MMAPCGKPTKANRFGGAPAGVCAHAVAAGFIASSSGSAMLAPTPFRTVRRETCFWNTNIVVRPSRFSLLSSTPGGPEGPPLRLRSVRRHSRLWHPSHPELLAPHDTLDQRRKPVIRSGGAAHDA